MRSEAGSLDQRIETLVRRREQIRTQQTDAHQLVQATVVGALNVLERRFRSLRPLVSDIYTRLDPHPSFKVLDLEHEMYMARGTTRPIARDPQEKEPVNPLVVFSTSQANIAALSYFLALGWAAGGAALPFVLLDDPLQSLDDVNVLGFGDLCRFIRLRRQLVISTHEERFASLLMRKLAPRSSRERTLVLRFAGWDRTGPYIIPDEVPPQLDAAVPRLVEVAQT